MTNDQHPTTSNSLKWQCRRGMLELDLLLNAFVDQGLSALSEVELSLLEELLSYPDQVLLDLLLANSRASDPAMARLIDCIRQTELSSVGSS